MTIESLRNISLLVVGLIIVVWPKTVWKFTESWKFWGEDREPSATAIRILEILGAIFIGAGLYFLLFV